jgi:hypothetical protein
MSPSSRNAASPPTTSGRDSSPVSPSAASLAGVTPESETDGLPNSRDSRLTCDSTVPEIVSVPVAARIRPMSSGTARSANSTHPATSDGESSVRLRRSGPQARPGAIGRPNTTSNPAPFPGDAIIVPHPNAMREIA